MPFIMIENWWKKMNLPLLPRIIRQVITIFIINFAWLLFRYSDINQLKEVTSIFLGIKNNGFSISTVNISIQNNIFIIIACVLSCTPVFSLLGKMISAKACNSRSVAYLYQGMRTLFCLILLLLSLAAMAGNSFTPFLYNQF